MFIVLPYDRSKKLVLYIPAHIYCGNRPSRHPMLWWWPKMLKGELENNSRKPKGLLENRLSESLKKSQLTLSQGWWRREMSSLILMMTMMRWEPVNHRTMWQQHCVLRNSPWGPNRHNSPLISAERCVGGGGGQDIDGQLDTYRQSQLGFSSPEPPYCCLQNLQLFYDWGRQLRRIFHLQQYIYIVTLIHPHPSSSHNSSCYNHHSLISGYFPSFTTHTVLFCFMHRFFIYLLLWHQVPKIKKYNWTKPFLNIYCLNTYSLLMAGCVWSSCLCLAGSAVRGKLCCFPSQYPLNKACSALLELSL